jgi:Short C-terminal domain
MAATTAVIAGTAGAVQHHQQQKYAAQDQQQYEAQQYEAQQQAQYQAPPAAAPAAPAADDPMAEIQKLAQLHSAGALTDEEFAAAKAKILGI